MSKLKELVEWFNEGICEGDGKLIMGKARALLAEEQNQPVDFAAKYYNEVAKNSVLYDVGSELLYKLEQIDPNNPILEKAEEQLNGNGYSLGRPVAEEVEPLAVLADRKGYIRIQYDRYVDDTFSIYLGFGKLMEKEFYGSNYASAETAAHAYLNSLPDKGE